MMRYLLFSNSPSSALRDLPQRKVLVGMEQPVAEGIPPPADLQGFFIHLEQVRMRNQFRDVSG